MKTIIVILLISGITLNIYADESYCALEIKLNTPLPNDAYLLVTSEDWKKTLTIEEFNDLQKGPTDTRYFYDLPAQPSGWNTVSIVPLKKAGWFTFGYPLANRQLFYAKADRTYMKKVTINRNSSYAPENASGNADFVFNLDYNYDADGDGLGTEQEITYKTNPWNKDTDYDNLNDYQDVNGENITISINGQTPTNINTAATDPLNPDTDGDGVLDGTEVYGLAPYGFITDPNNPDTDGDGVIDGQDPNPLGITDANGDGVADEWVDLWQDLISQWGYSSSWLISIENPDADTDGDGISNRDEYENGTVPIVPNDHYETRILPSLLEIIANVDEIITAEFSVVDLSYEPSTGEVFQLSQSWANEIHPVPVNLQLKYLSTNEWYQENLPARFCSRFGIYNKFQFAINTANLKDNTTYKDKIIVVVGGIINVCEVRLLVGNSPANNHAPIFGSLIFPSNKVAVKDVNNVQLNWTAASDEDAGDSITYEVRCSAFHFTGVPDTMANDISQTTVQAVGWEEGLTDRLEYQRKYEWQVVARDSSGAAAFGPIWSFTTMPSNYVNIVILSSELRKGYIGRNYKEQLSAAYGFPSYQWEIKSGSLPEGLLLRNDGVVYGEPTVAGNYNFSVEAKDSVGGKTITTINLEIGTNESGDAGNMGHGAAGQGSF